MRIKKILLFLQAALFAQAAFQIDMAPVIEISGNKFFNSSDKSQFFIRGVAYQRPLQYRKSPIGYIDSLALPSLCLKDLEYFIELGVNTVRVYQVDPAANHDVCMNVFAAHGIYVFVDLSEPRLSVNRDRPAWDTDLYERYTSVVDTMSSYTNVIGFIAGNEVVNSVENSNAAAFVKASVRDVKNYIRRKKYRAIPVGYASSDESLTRLESANYFVCTDESNDAAVDFYALNMFEWCGYASFETCGYRERTIEFSLMPVPVFFSEFGCNTLTPRPFTEIGLIFGPSMSHVWSGGIIYEFFQNENRFGLVHESASGRISKLDDYDTVRLRLIETTSQGVHHPLTISDAKFQVHCPPVSSTWHSLPILPPTPDEGKCECLQTTLSCILTPYQDVHENNFLDELCLKTDCSDVKGNSTNGIYGKYSGCGLRQKLSYILNKYWLENHRNPELCDFDKRSVLISNTGFTDLDNLLASDGRTCREALEGEFTAHKKAKKNRRKRHSKKSLENFHSPVVYAQSNDGYGKSRDTSGWVYLVLIVLIYLNT